jgi:hypothetical protein
MTIPSPPFAIKCGPGLGRGGIWIPSLPSAIKAGPGFGRGGMTIPSVPSAIRAGPGLGRGGIRIPSLSTAKATVTSSTIRHSSFFMRSSLITYLTNRNYESD